MKKTTKRILIPAVSAALILVCAALLFLLSGNNRAFALVFKGKLTEKRMAISDGSYDHALVLSGAQGDSSNVPIPMNGDFSINFDVPDVGGERVLNTVRFDFTDSSGKTFSVGYGNSTEFTGFYVEANGEKAGVYYGPAVLTYTCERNAAGLYTTLSQNRDVGFRLEIETMRIYAFSGNEDRLVWDFGREYNDGRGIGVVFDPFVDYQVSVTFENAAFNKTANLYVYSVNGQTFTGPSLKDNAAPRVFAAADTNPILNQPYRLPAPGVFDVFDGSISANKVNVKLTRGDETLLSAAYADGMTYTFTEPGVYTLEYSAKDSARQTGSYSVALSPVRASDAAVDFSYASELSETTVGVGSVVRLPQAVVTTAASRLKGAASTALSVTKDGNAVGLTNGTFVADEAGEYIVTYTADYRTADISKRHSITAVEGLAVLSDVSFAPSYKWNSELEIPDAVVTVSGADHKAEKMILYPTGAAYSNDHVTLSEEGVYTVQYSAKTDAGDYLFRRSFRVAKTASDFFVDVNGKSDITEGCVHYYQQATGVLLSMKPGAEIIYTNPLDLSGSSRGDFFITYYIVPNTVGSSDFGALRFFLIDKEDENNYVEILTIDSGAINTGGVGSYNRASTNGQILGYGYESDNELSRGQTNESGYTTLAGFRGTPFFTNTKDALEGGFALDYETKKLYPKTSYYFSIVGAHSNICQITDLDEPNFYEVPWKGFTSGECYLKIVPERVSTRATVVVTSIGGVSLAAGTPANVYTPSVSLVDYESGLPDGIAGTRYPIPEYVAQSKFYGSVASSVKVYRQVSGKLCELNVTNGSFLPETAGDYLLVLTATNPDGISVQRNYTVTVKESAPALSIHLENTAAKKGFVADPFAISFYTVSGNAGNAEVKISVTSPDGKTQPVTDAFIPDRSGDWRVTYTAADYLGREATVSYSVSVSAHTEPVVQTAVSLPAGVINGFTYHFPAATALDYSRNETSPATINAEIYVTDANGRKKLPADGAYTASVSKHGASVKIEYIFRGASGAVTKLEYDLAGLIVANGTQISIPSYFVAEGIDKVEAGTEKTRFGFDSDASLAFSRAVIAHGAKIVFNPDASANNFGRIRVTLTDSVDAREAITFTITRLTAAEQNSTFSLNGGVSKITKGSFFGNSSDLFIYTYNNIGHTIADASGTAIAAVSETMYGEPFDGFSSGMIYIRLDFEDVNGRSAVYLHNICGQAINNAVVDRTIPTVYLKHSVAGIHTFGSSVTISDIYAADMLSEIRSATVEVTCGEQTLLPTCSAFETHSLVLSSYGKYFVTYTVIDSAGRKYVEDEILYVKAVEETSVQADAPIAKSAKVGETLTFPKATVTGGAGETSYYVLVMEPNGKLRRNDKGEVTFDRAGEWVIRYFAFDEYYNCSFIDYTVTVK